MKSHKLEIRVTVDAVVFGYSKESGLSVLLIKRKFDPYQGMWALPGGFVGINESLEEAVERELKEESGVQINYLEQLYSFGEPNRDPRSRIISVAYFALINPNQFHLDASTDAVDAQWFNQNQLPDLAFDHQEILEIAERRLRTKIMYETIGFELLNEKFAFSDLESLYTTLLGKEIDRRNFKKKMMSFGVLEKLEEKVKPLGGGRPGNLFRFNKARYQIFLKEGGMFGL